MQNFQNRSGSVFGRDPVTVLDHRATATISLGYSPLAWCVIVAVLAIACQYFVWDVNADTSWIITMCERVLAGERLYVDLIETNPPMTVWLYLPAVAFARMVGVKPELAVYAYAYIVCFAGLAFASYVAIRARFADNTDLYRLLPLFLALLIALPQRDFSQREQFGVALMLPLLVLMAWRLNAGVDNQPNWMLAVGVGVSGSLIVLIKPYYAIMILAPALYLAWRKRSIGALFLPEYWAIGAMCLSYLAAATLIYPEFLDQVLPLLSDTYMRITRTIPTIRLFAPASAITFMAFLLLRKHTPAPLADIVMLAAAAGLASLFYQGKGWSYHAYPAFSLGLAALAIVALKNIRFSPVLKLAIFSTAGFLIAYPFIQGSKTDAGMIQTVRAATTRPTVGLVGAGIQIGHPFTRMVDGVWTDIYCSDWAADAALGLAIRERASGNTERAEHYDKLAASMIKKHAQRLIANPPDILVVQKSPGVPAQLLGDPTMAGFMDDYRHLAEDRERTVFQRIVR